MPICHPALAIETCCRAGHQFLYCDPFRFLPIYQSVIQCWPLRPFAELAINFCAMLLAQDSGAILFPAPMPLCHPEIFRSTGPTDLKSRASPPGLNFSAGPPGPQLMRSSSRLQLPASIALLAPGKSCHKFSRLTNIDKVFPKCQSLPPNLNRWASPQGFNYVAVAQTLHASIAVLWVAINCHRLPQVVITWQSYFAFSVGFQASIAVLALQASIDFPASIVVLALHAYISVS